MDSRTRDNLSNTIPNSNPKYGPNSSLVSKLREDYKIRRSFSATGKPQEIKSSYFSMESLLLLVCLTASLLILPLVLPPLPPPPFLLLLLPIGILGLLMMIVFMPSNVRDITYACV